MAWTPQDHSDLEMMESPEQWPLWPLLPLRRGDEHGFLVDQPTGIRSIVRAAGSEILGSYPDMTALVEDGWKVD